MYQPYCPGERAAQEAGESHHYEAEPCSEPRDTCDDMEVTDELRDYCRRLVIACQARNEELRRGVN